MHKVRSQEGGLKEERNGRSKIGKGESPWGNEGAILSPPPTLDTSSVVFATHFHEQKITQNRKKLFGET